MTNIAVETGTIICVEDDSNIADLISTYLRKDGFRVLLADNGRDALELIRRESPRLVILDIGLAGDTDGFRVCQTIRTSSRIPIIFLTARDSEIDRVLGLEIGADDYITKPFSARELCARVRALLRRVEFASSDEPQISYGPICVNVAARSVQMCNRTVEVTSQEFDLLIFLLQRKGVALSRRQILDGAWEPGWFGDERTVDVHVRQLRKKFGDVFKLETVWGVGYRLT